MHGRDEQFMQKISQKKTERKSFLEKPRHRWQDSWSIRSKEVVLWKCVDHWKVQKETVYKECDHLAM